jgi:hypothetical protein
MNPATTSTSSIGSTSSSLIQRIKAQDADAWTKLVRLYGPWSTSGWAATGLMGLPRSALFASTTPLVRPP